MNNMPVKLAITIPAYNEEATIGSVIREIPRNTKAYCTHPGWKS